MDVKKIDELPIIKTLWFASPYMMAEDLFKIITELQQKVNELVVEVNNLKTNNP